MPSAVGGALTPRSPLTALQGVGAKTAALFAEHDVHTLEDLIWYFPANYEDRSHVVAIADIHTTGIYTIRCNVQQSRARKTRQRKTVVEALVADESGSIQCVWFNQPYIVQKIKNGEELFLSGKITMKGSLPFFTNPFVDTLTHQQFAKKIVPVYPLHSTLKQHQVRSMIRQALAIIPAMNEDIPLQVSAKHNLQSIKEALTEIHQPTSVAFYTQAQRRIVLSRLIDWMMAMNATRAEDVVGRAPACAFPIEELKEHLHTLQFQLTPDQKKALWDIIQDLSQDTPMIRMLCGEVGSGKTIVAALASIAIIRAGHQVACVAPTDILAQQHLQSFTRALEHTGYTVVLHTHNHQATEQELQRADLIIGTHALLNKTASFRSLGLVIVDEQHRFGVLQRAQLLSSGVRVPHFLSLTATPIPRTLALSIFGKLAISTITSLPHGRKPIITRLMNEEKRPLLYNFLQKHIDAGEGVFVVCPLIDPSDVLSVASVERVREQLRPHLPQARIGVLHGKLKKNEQQHIMHAFRSRELDVIISTTVVEVGVDVPHASIIVIEDADRFGLATLHQLRGRVGRSHIQSYCIVTTQRRDAGAQKRLAFFSKTRSGFELARYDAEHRGAGNLLGIEQSGASEIISYALRYPELVTQAHLIAQEESVYSGRANRALHLE
ncbi:MAG: ATP-dependent DNA helicase RecG [Candidatus Kerfeldbacteria bacterium]|nr:ATP-dependent DNA helicase RecG [Candidatus Kerfeldbacteria bacterium]